MGAHGLRLLAGGRRHAPLRDPRRRARHRRGRSTWRGAQALFKKAPAARLAGRRADHGAGPRLRSVRDRASRCRRVYDRSGSRSSCAGTTCGPTPAAKNAPTSRCRSSEEELGRPGAAAPAEGGTDIWGQEAEPAAGRRGSGRARRRQDIWGEDGAAKPAPARARRRVLGRGGDPAAGPAPRRASRSPTSCSATARTRVDLWFLDLAGSRVRQFVGQGSAALTVLEGSEVEGRGRLRRRRVVGRVRARPALDGRRELRRGTYVPIAFSCGTARRASAATGRGLTQWCYVYLPPREKPSAVGPMVGTALGVLGLELLAVVWIRKRRPGTGLTAAPACVTGGALNGRVPHNRGESACTRGG